MQEMIRAAPDRVAVYGIENVAGTPVYVHAKVCVIDDTWASIGSDNFNRRSWTHDSELSAVVIDTAEGDDGYARRLRLTLAAEHLDRPADDCVDAAAMFAAYADCADRAGRLARRRPRRAAAAGSAAPDPATRARADAARARAAGVPRPARPGRPAGAAAQARRVLSGPGLFAIGNVGDICASTKPSGSLDASDG